MPAQTFVKGSAAGAFAFTSNVAADDTVIIGHRTYTFAADPTGEAYEVDVGSDLDDSIGNLVAAINASGTDDDEYGAGTAAHELFSATADLANDEIDLTARAAGIHVNGIRLAATSPGANDITAGATSFGAISGGTDGAGDPHAQVAYVLAEKQISADAYLHLAPLSESDS